VVIMMDVPTLAEALFVSPLRPTDRPALPQVRAAIADSLRRMGARGCLAAMAEEFGDHPETAPARMRWALSLVRAL
jgi:hypothetical protein